MKFKINNTEYTIEAVSEAVMNNEANNNYTVGLTIYKQHTIMLLENYPNILRTLKHELAHVWLYEYGHNQQDYKKYDYEDICEIVASSNDFINEIVEQYKNKETITYQTIDGEERTEEVEEDE